MFEKFKNKFAKGKDGYNEDSSPDADMRGCKTLPDDFADKLFNCEMEIEKDYVQMQDVNELLNLYARAIEYYESEQNDRYLIFKNKTQALLIRPNIQRAMTQEADNIRAQTEPDVPYKEQKEEIEYSQQYDIQRDLVQKHKAFQIQMQYIKQQDPSKEVASFLEQQLKIHEYNRNILKRDIEFQLEKIKEKRSSIKKQNIQKHGFFSPQPYLTILENSAKKENRKTRNLTNVKCPTSSISNCNKKEDLIDLQLWEEGEEGSDQYNFSLNTEPNDYFFNNKLSMKTEPSINNNNTNNNKYLNSNDVFNEINIQAQDIQVKSKNTLESQPNEILYENNKSNENNNNTQNNNNNFSGDSEEEEDIVFDNTQNSSNNYNNQNNDNNFQFNSLNSQESPTQQQHGNLMKSSPMGKFKLFNANQQNNNNNQSNIGNNNILSTGHSSDNKEQLQKQQFLINSNQKSSNKNEKNGNLIDFSQQKNQAEKQINKVYQKQKQNSEYQDDLIDIDFDNVQINNGQNNNNNDFNSSSNQNNNNNLICNPQTDLQNTVEDDTNEDNNGIINLQNLQNQEMLKKQQEKEIQIIKSAEVKKEKKYKQVKKSSQQQQSQQKKRKNSNETPQNFVIPF